MKTAKSLIYGGELIDAIDCTYDDFKRLAPLCPNCSNPVYLRAGGDRISPKGKEYTVSQHWAHFAGKSAEEVAACELRVNGYSDADRERIQRIARGQREKWIRRWLWQAFKAWCDRHISDRYCDVDGILDVIKAIGNRQEKGFDLTRKTGLHPLTVNAFRANSSSEFVEFLCSSLDAVSASEESALMEVLKPETDKTLHLKLVGELISFLQSKRQEGLLELLIEATVFVGRQQILMHLQDLKSNPSLIYEDYSSKTTGKERAMAISETLLFLIGAIPWASEFARLEAQPQPTA
jgi:hypothetical protein